MDVSNASYNIHKYNKNKGSQMGRTKKVLKKKTKKTTGWLLLVDTCQCIMMTLLMLTTLIYVCHTY
jgi:hypothetical protein